MSFPRLPVLFGFLLFVSSSWSQQDSIALPGLNDDYSKFVVLLETGITDIDYTRFRDSFLESEMFWKKGSDYDSLQKETVKAIRAEDYPAVIKNTKAMLSIDYTSLFAHKYLQGTYRILGDSTKYHQYHDIEFGLLYSIVDSGDGKTCETGWHVTQIEEEYFILNMIDADLQSQSISSSKNNMCDKMEVKVGKEKRTYYFEANKVFEMERKMFSGKH